MSYADCINKSTNSFLSFNIIDRPKGRYSPLLNNWVSYGFEKDLFYKYPSFIDFMFSSKLINQIRISRDSIKEIDQQPHLLLQGKWTAYADILKRFEVCFDRNYNESFLTCKADQKVYTYLDRGLGLEEFHPYKEGLLKPISKLSENEYLSVLTIAHKFERPASSSLGEKNHILQIVTSTLKTDSSLWENFKKFFLEPKHPFVRLINSSGDVFEAGFGLFSFMKKKFLIKKRGFFRSVDVWEYIKVQERVVTNIAITADEFKKARRYVSKYLNNEKKMAFNFLFQNCVVFTQEFVKEVINIDIPINVPIFKVIKKILPEFIKKLGRSSFFNKIKKLKDFTYIHFFYPFEPIFKVIKKIVTIVLFILLAPIRFIIKAIFCSFGGKKFKIRTKRDSFFKLKHIFDLKIVFPLQQWQKKQSSTVIYENPTKLKQTIILPLES